MAGDSPRDLALEILRRVEQEEAYSSLLLQRLGGEDLAPRDRALVTELVYGVLRRRLYLDRIIADFSSRPLEAIDPLLVLVLRLGLYQILFLDRIPAHASVNEAVTMARRRLEERGPGAARFANALLRAVARDRAGAGRRTDRRGAEETADLPIVESHPEWLVRRWVERFGLQEARLLLSAQNRPAPLAIRVRGSTALVAEALAAEGVRTRPSRYLPEFLVAEQGVPQATESFRRGDFYIQDEAAGLVSHLANVGPGDRVLDLCAAPGGKALALADRVGESGLVVAGDRSVSRLRLLRDNARRLRLSRCAAGAADASAEALPLRKDVVFESVIVDAPCSGTGVIRRHPELRYRVTPEDLERLARLQLRLLENAAGRVRPGGTLVYAGCSMEPEEGVRQVGRFLADHSEFAPEDPRGDLPPPARHLVTGAEEGPCLVTLPHRDDLDGFFAVRFRRHR